MRRLVAGIAAAAVVWLVAAPAQAAQKDVSMHNTSFDPNKITISEGDTIKWTNNDLVTHTVHSDEVAELNSADLGPTATYTFTFGPHTAGTYNYYCTIHGKNVMSGQIVVQGPVTTTIRATTTTARPVVTTRPAVTTTRAAATSSTLETSTTLAEETTTTEESTTTTSGDIAIKTDDGGGTSGLAVGALIVGILAVLGGGGYALYRIRGGA